MSEPDVITPTLTKPKSLGGKFRYLKQSLTTKEGLLGGYDYSYLFKPNLPFMKNDNFNPPFFG